jgi:hypothetical protein
MTHSSYETMLRKMFTWREFFEEDHYKWRLQQYEQARHFLKSLGKPLPKPEKEGTQEWADWYYQQFLIGLAKFDDNLYGATIDK